jgi:hypothetical protein
MHVSAQASMTSRQGSVARMTLRFRRLMNSVSAPAMRIAVVGLASIVFTACGPSMRQLAVNDFRTKHAACEPITVRERPDLENEEYSQAMGSDMTVYEVSGCNAVAVYPCFPFKMTPRDQPNVPAICSTPDWCSPTGCLTDELAARHKFVDDKTCPLDRVTAHVTTPAPPSDVAADPERMRLWTAAHTAKSPYTFMTASGCGSEVLYECVAGACKALAPEGSAPPAAPAPPTSPSATPPSPAPTGGVRP